MDVFSGSAGEALQIPAGENLTRRVSVACPSGQHGRGCADGSVCRECSAGDSWRHVLRWVVWAFQEDSLPVFAGSYLKISVTNSARMASFVSFSVSVTLFSGRTET